MSCTFTGSQSRSPAGDIPAARPPRPALFITQLLYNFFAMKAEAQDAVRHPGPLVKEARRGAGLTQAELARRLGTRQPVIARLESPRSNPRFETVRRAVAATGHEVEMHLRPLSVDETMIASNLRLSPAARLKRFRDAYDSVARLATGAELRGS